jgi:hypothetical protein
MRSVKTFLTKTDRSEGLADRDPASRYELPRRLAVIGFETPPGSVRGTLERRGANIFVKCVFVTNCSVIAFLYHCKTCIVVPKYIVYSKCNERGKRRCMCPLFVSFTSAPST